MLLVTAARAFAQDPHVHNAAGEQWEWNVDARLFFGYNYQDRKFTDFDEWESQNWLMLMGGRSFGSSQLHVMSMFSAELITLPDIGSPQVFQTGETFKKAPLIDYQHPHDLFMTLGVDYSHQAGAAKWLASAYVVGPAPLGPESFMHRESAAENPQTPLSHHFLDSTHIANDVLSAGVEFGGVRLEAGAFHGREPDENRHDIDGGPIDSYAGRLTWTRGEWSTQVSAGHLNVPEASSPYDLTRVTASVSYTDGGVDFMAAFGQNREFFGKFEAYLLEGTWRPRLSHAIFMRAEYVEKDILDAGFHPIGFAHRHRVSPIAALTVGYVRDFVRGSYGVIGIGADFTGYRVPANLRESYGSPHSYHVFVRYRR